MKALAGEVYAAVVFCVLEAADKLAAAHFQPFMPAFQLDFCPFEQRAGFAQLFNRGDLANQLIAARLRQTLTERRLTRSADIGNVKQSVAVFVFHRHRMRRIGDQRGVVVNEAGEAAFVKRNRLGDLRQLAAVVAQKNRDLVASLAGVAARLADPELPFEALPELRRHGVEVLRRQNRHVAFRHRRRIDRF